MSEPRWLDDEEQCAWRAFIAVQRLFFERIERDLQADAGMPMSYYEVLVRLSEVDERALRMSELADATGSSRSALSHAIARLEAKGWVERRSCPSDLRGTHAVLTDAGWAALQAASPGHVASVRRHLFDVLTPDQVQALRAIDDALLAHLTDVAPAVPGS